MRYRGQAEGVVRWAAVAAMLLCVLCVCKPAVALDGSFRLSQYGHTSWRVQDGYLSGSPGMFAQTPDGYLWVGTAGGLTRFDGAQFVREERASVSGNQFVSALYVARDGSLWVGRPGSIIHMHGDVFEKTSILAQPNEFAEYADGEVWFARTRMGAELGAICRLDPPTTHCIGEANGVRSRYADHLVQSTDGALWIGGSGGVTRWSKDRGDDYFGDTARSHADVSGLQGLARTRDGVVVALASNDGLDIRKFEGGEWSKLEFRPNPTLAISTIFVDKSDHLWIGTFTDGLYRAIGASLDHFGSGNGLSSDRVDAIFEDSDGNIWIATPQGIDRLRDLAVVSFSRKEGLGSEQARAVVARGDEIWVSDGRFLDHVSMRKDSFSVESEQLSQPQIVTSIADAGLGGLWVGIDDRLTLYSGHTFQDIKQPDGRPLGMIEELAVDAAGVAWARNLDHPDKLFRIVHDHVDRTFGLGDLIYPRLLPTADSIRIVASTEHVLRPNGDQLEAVWGAPKGPKAASVRQVLSDAPDAFWMATSSGIARMDNGVTRWLTKEKGGLPCNTIFALQLDLEKGLWAHAPCGIFYLSRAEIDAWLGDSSRNLSAKVLDEYDGANPASPDFAPRAARTANGQIWFPNGHSVQMIDPRRAFVSPRVPGKPRIEKAVADRAELDFRTELAVPSRTRDLEIDYSVPSLRAPQRTSFRYRLEGYDPDWHTVDARRQAVYTGVGPGRYLFSVAASNGIQWGEPTTLQVDIAYAYYQTWWFKLSVIAFGVLLVALAYRFRVRQVAALTRGRLEAAMRERERIARELHDTLLQSIQGLILHVDDAAQSLPAGDTVRAQLEGALVQADSALIEGRDRVHDMRTRAAYSVDIIGAFTQFAEELKSQYPTPCLVSATGEPRSLKPEVREEAFWIGREAIINACRHAAATQIDVRVDFGRRHFILLVEDDGIGIGAASDVKRAKFGITGMRERSRAVGGDIDLVRRPSRGTSVRLSIPARRAYDREALASNDQQPDVNE